MYAVFTTEGVLAHCPQPQNAPRGFATEDEAESRCRKANDQAERLGIATRYEVRSL